MGSVWNGCGTRILETAKVSSFIHSKYIHSILFSFSAIIFEEQYRNQINKNRNEVFSYLYRYYDQATASNFPGIAEEISKFYWNSTELNKWNLPEFTDVSLKLLNLLWKSRIKISWYLVVVV